MKMKWARGMQRDLDICQFNQSEEKQIEESKVKD
jgi:hypothetical protein